MYLNIKMIWWVGGGNFIYYQDINCLIKVWQKLEMIVVFECYWIVVVKYVDIVLLIIILFECNDLMMIGDYSNQYIVLMKQVVVL